MKPLVEFYKEHHILDCEDFEDIQDNFIKSVTNICRSHQPMGIINI